MSETPRKRSHKRMDPDVKAISVAARALRKSTPRMLRANVEFVIAHLFDLPRYDLFVTTTRRWYT